jgi:hypothetical protein
MPVVADLIRAWPAAVAAGVLPGYFWALVLRPASGLGERLAFSTVLSMASVPVVAVALARAAGSGIVLWVAVAAVLIVLGSGALVLRLKGAAPGSAAPVLPAPPRITRPLPLALACAGLLLALVSTFGSTGPVTPLTAAVLLAAGAVAGWRPPSPEPEATPVVHAATEPRATEPRATESRATEPRASTNLASRGPEVPDTRSQRPQTWALAAVLALTGLRAYLPVIAHDWPYLPGGDQFSHAVMAEQMMWHGSYPTYLVYPPGFSALTAVVCRLSGLSPLVLFPVLAPALVVVTALGAYALAARLWGAWYGVAGAALSGLVLTGAFAGFTDGRYPDLVAAYFLLVMAVAALASLFQAPGLRSGALTVVVGASVPLYHSVVTLYLVVLLAVVAVTGLPYLIRSGRRRDARVLTVTLACVAVLAACYAAYTYKLAVGGHAATSKAVSIALGSQDPLSPQHVLAELTPPVVWLGLFGFAVLAVSLRHRLSAGQLLAVVTVLAWCVLMYAGSRTALDGFPQRFERDLGAPLTVTGALALGMIGRSLLAWRPGSRGVAAATAAAVLAVLMLSVQASANLSAENHRGKQMLTRPVAAAGRWLRQHNTGGTIISTPYMNPGISNRAVLAMGGYTGLQSYSPRRIAHPRSLPPAGKQPLLDSQTVLLHPVSCQAQGIISRDGVRYVVLYKTGSGADLAAFAAAPARYRPVFSNQAVIIYAPVRGTCG